MKNGTEKRERLTLADETTHKVIGKHLSSQALKEIPVLSEEGKLTPYNERKAWEYFWIIDPLDGTKEFIKRKDLAKHYVSIIILACLPCPHRQANAGIQKAWIQGNEQKNWIPDQVGNDNTGISTTLFDFLRNYQSSCASWFNFSYPAPGSSAPNRLYPRWQETASVLWVYRQAG